MTHVQSIEPIDTATRAAEGANRGVLDARQCPAAVPSITAYVAPARRAAGIEPLELPRSE